MSKISLYQSFSVWFTQQMRLFCYHLETSTLIVSVYMLCCCNAKWTKIASLKSNYSSYPGSILSPLTFLQYYILYVLFKSIYLWSITFSRAKRNAGTMVFHVFSQIQILFISTDIQHTTTRTLRLLFMYDFYQNMSIKGFSMFFSLISIFIPLNSILVKLSSHRLIGRSASYSEKWVYLALNYHFCLYNIKW